MPDADEVVVAVVDHERRHLDERQHVPNVELERWIRASRGRGPGWRRSARRVPTTRRSRAGRRPTGRGRAPSCRCPSSPRCAPCRSPGRAGASRPDSRRRGRNRANPFRSTSDDTRSRMRRGRHHAPSASRGPARRASLVCEPSASMTATRSSIQDSIGGRPRRRSRTCRSRACRTRAHARSARASAGTPRTAAARRSPRGGSPSRRRGRRRRGPSPIHAVGDVGVAASARTASCQRHQRR